VDARGPEGPIPVLARLREALDRHGVSDFAITASVALGFWAAPRQTRDIDLCGVVPPEAVTPLLAQHDGVRSGPGELPDVIRFRVGDWDVDLFVAKRRYDEVCLARAVPVELGGILVKVVTPEDLLIHKLIKLRTDRRRVLQDLADLRALLEERGETLDWSYLRQWLPEDERELAESLASLDDEAILARLLRR
jgi:hypothetical protein